MVLVVVLVGSIAQAVAVPARARAASEKPPISLGQTTNIGGGARAGVRSAPPTGQALAGTLDQMTGLTPAQVQLQDVCPAVAPGMARCAAQALILQSTHKLVRPDVAHTRPLTLGPQSAQPAGERRVRAGCQPTGSRHPRISPAGIRPCLAVSDRRPRRHGGGR
ncbi:MAG: hypothetical protein ACXVXL_23515 [Solirubrobacteraceae bacterium]